jgi:uncharacterized membrane protein YqjE
MYFIPCYISVVLWVLSGIYRRNYAATVVHILYIIAGHKWLAVVNRGPWYLEDTTMYWENMARDRQEIEVIFQLQHFMVSFTIDMYILSV